MHEKLPKSLSDCHLNVEKREKLEMESQYGFGKIVLCSFKHAVEKVREELKKEGFGVITEIDVAETLKKKLNQQIPPYLILGACNPEFAHRALIVDQSIGLLLPCNIVIRQDTCDTVYVEIMDPNIMVKFVENQEIAAIAQELKQRLERVMQAL